MIDKDIPLPKRRAPMTQAGAEARQMVPGDSRLCDTPSERETVRSAIVGIGGKCASRKVDGGWRVWRVE